MEILAKLRTQLPDIEVVFPVSKMLEASSIAIELAKKHTGRTRVLIAVGENSVFYKQKSMLNGDDVFIITAGNTSELCDAVATAPERIAAIVVKPALEQRQASAYYYRKVRELASAEGAVMIWDELEDLFSGENAYSKFCKSNRPDLICLRCETKKEKYWVAGRHDILKMPGRWDAKMLS